MTSLVTEGGIAVAAPAAEQPRAATGPESRWD
jgi:hypothetical protein